MKKIGIVGTGIMGHGMAVNFLKHGYELFVWNRSSDKLTDLAEAGAKQCENPRQVAENADVVFDVVADDDASRVAWFGQDGLIAGADEDSILITCATLSLDFVDELDDATKKADITFLDMPLTGGRGGAEQGQLSLLVGGDRDTLDSIREELGAISASVFHFGGVGMGMRFKLMLNTLSAIHINAAAQAVELVKKAGVDQDVFYKALFDGAMGPASPATNILLRDKDMPTDEVKFASRWVEKDLRYAKQMAERYGCDFDLLNDTQADYAKMSERGFADRDWSKIVDLYR